MLDTAYDARETSSIRVELALLTPAEPRKKRGKVTRESTPGELQEDAVSLQNAKGSEKGSAQGQEWQWPRKVGCARMS